MKDKILYVLGGGVLIAVFLFLKMSFCGNQKIVIVDSQRVLEEYSGFKEAEDAYELKIKEISENFDSQRRDYETKLQEFEILEKNLGNEQKLKNQTYLLKMKEELLLSGSALEKQSSIEEEKLLQGVLNKVNDFIKRYGKYKGYSVIIGANGQGNVLYMEEKMDITSEIINSLNMEYVEGVKY